MSTLLNTTNTPNIFTKYNSQSHFKYSLHATGHTTFVIPFLLIVYHEMIQESQLTVYPKKYAHGFVVLCFVVVMQSFIMNSHEVFIHIHQGCFAGTGAIVRLPQCQWSKPDGYGKISQCITTTKHSKAKTVCIFLGIYCISFHRLAQVKSSTTCTARNGLIQCKINAYFPDTFTSIFVYPTSIYQPCAICINYVTHFCAIYYWIKIPFHV